MGRFMEWNMCQSWILLVLGTLFAAGTSDDVQSLHCFRCISMECKTSTDICSMAKNFIQAEISNYYYTDGFPLPDCPDPSNLNAWEQLAENVPSSLPCGEVGKGQATCVLGRFQVTSVVLDSTSNLTTYGTVLGCARKSLLKAVQATKLGKDPKVITTLNTQIGCHLDESQSVLRDSLQHFLELEHCSQVSDMCFNTDYCIHPRYAEVRSWNGNYYGGSVGPEVGFFKILIWVAAIVGLLVVGMTFAGIKYA